MFSKFRVIMLEGGLILGGCATQGGYQPTIDTYNHPNANRVSRDLAECKQLAEQASGGTAKKTGEVAIIGGLIGAAAGAAIGADTGYPGQGRQLGPQLVGLAAALKMGLARKWNLRLHIRIACVNVAIKSLTK